MTAITRCEWSDLPIETCAHCLGTDVYVGEPEVRGEDAAPGRRIWPPRAAKQDAIGDYLALPPTWAPEAGEAGECRCGRPTRDYRWVCDDCGDLLSRALGEIPWVVEQLDVSIARQRAAGAIGGGKGGSAGLLWHERAADAKRALHSLLSTWVRFCEEESIAHSSPKDGLPEDRPVSMSRWLLWRVDGLMSRDIGAEAVEELTDAVAESRRIILWKRRTRVYLGPCRFSQVCGGDVYAEEDAKIGACEACADEVVVATKRADLEQQLDDMLYSAQEVARLAVFLGLEVPRERVRTQIRTWENRGRIIAKGAGADGQSLFRYGDVKPMLYAQYARPGSNAIG